MSELIDSVVDVAKITAEFKAISEQVEKLKSEIIDFSSTVNKEVGNIRAAKNQDDLAKSSKVLNDTMIKSKQTLSEYEKQQKQLQVAQEKLNLINSDANKELIKINLTTQERNALLKAEAVLNDKNSGTLEKLTAQNKILAIEKRKLNLETDEGKKRLEEIIAAENENNKALKIGNNEEQKRIATIGKYEDAIRNAIKSLNDEATQQKQNIKMLELVAKSEHTTTEEKKKAVLALEENKTALAKTNEELQKLGVSAENSGDAISGMLPRLGGLPGTLITIAGGADASEGAFKGLGKTIVETGKAMLKNPFVLIGAAIIGLIKGIKDAIGESEERTNAISTAFAQFKPILRTVGDGFEFLADAVIKTVGFLGKAFSAVTEFLRINPKGSSDAFVSAEKSKQAAILETRKLNEQAAEQEAIIAEQREILSDKENYTYKQRIEALKIAGEAEKKLSSDRQRIAELNLKALQEEAALDDNNAEMNDKLSAAIVAVNTARIESANVGRKLAKEQQKLTKENEADLKAESDARKAAAKEREEAAKETARKLIEADRMLTDSKISLMEEGEAKQIAILNEGFKRKLEDLQANGQLTNELEKNLTAANAIELQKIRDDFAKQKKDKEKSDFDTMIADFEKNTQKEVDLLSTGYREKETELKRQYAAGKISKEKYEEDLLKIQSEALKEANDLTIKNLQKELEIANISTDKRAEISAKIRDLQIENENAVLDATIEANQKKVDSDKEVFGKRLQIAEQLTAAGMELFQAIGDSEAQQSENRLAELEKQQAANDDYFAKRQENLDNAIMSDASREAAQKAIDEEKAKRDKAILDKKREEEIRQAKWEKAQALTSAIISTALATIKALVDPGGVLGVVFAALAAATGATQIATILSRPIPAFEKGGITGDGLALWGETRPEVALTKTGDVMFTERPTVSKFDAGTRIFKSIEDFEKNMISTGNKNFEFDYQKMAELMPRDSIELNGNGSWTVINKENNRRSVINRRIKLN